MRREGENKKMGLRHKWKHLIAKIMIFILMLNVMPIEAYASENENTEDTAVVVASEEESGTQTIVLKDIVTVNGAKLQSISKDILGMIGRGRVLYLNLDLTDVDEGLVLTDVQLNMTASGYTTSITARDITNCVTVSGCNYAGTLNEVTYYGDAVLPTITDKEIMGSSLPTSLEAWQALDVEKVPTVWEALSLGSGNKQIDITNYVVDAWENGQKKITLALYGADEENYSNIKGTLDPTALNLAITAVDEAALAQYALTQIEEYLKQTYGDSLQTVTSSIELPEQSAMGIGEEYAITWEKQNNENDGIIVYKAYVVYGEQNVEQEFTFTLLDEVALEPSILRVQLYSDKAGTTALETPKASSGESSWYLRSDYVTFVSFDLEKLQGTLPEKYVQEALFQVKGKKTGGGAGNTLSVICLDDPLTETSTIPSVLLRDGSTESLTASNIENIAGKTILEEQRFSQLNTDTNELELTKSIVDAVRSGKDRITFLLLSEENQSTGCDVDPSTAGLSISLEQYSDEKRCEEALEYVKEQYADYYLYQDVVLPLEDANGAQITWESLNQDVISNEGKVGTVSGLVDVLMNVTAQSGEAMKTTSLTFHACDENTYWVYSARNYLKEQLDYLQNKEVENNLNLITSVGDKVGITWSSNKPTIVDSQGNVTRPAVNQPDEEVTLTANIVSLADNTIHAEYALKIIVKAEEDSDGASAVAKRYLEILRMTYDGSVIVNDYYLPASMDATDKTTTKVEWSVKEESEYFSIGELNESGYPVTVVQPDEPQKINVHCKVMTTGVNNVDFTAVEEADFVVTVAAEQEETSYGKESLEHILNLSQALYDEVNGNEKLLATVQTDGDENDIYDIKSSYNLELECDIAQIIENEKFGFLYYPAAYDGNEISSYAKVQIEGTGNTLQGTPGALDADKAQLFLAAIENGDSILKDSSASEVQYKAAIVEIVNAGIELLSSANIDNTVAINAIPTAGTESPNRENVLVFSVERQKLMTKVWEAKTTLCQSAQLYLLSDKRALVEQIQNSENALCGTYQYPHNSYREFRSRRDDEVLVFCYSHTVRFRNYDSILYGLEPMLTYYKEQEIISGSYYETTIPVSEAIAVNEQSTTPSAMKAAELTVGLNSDGLKRFGLLKFDLSALQGDVKYASLQLTSQKSDKYLNDIYLENEDSWTGTTAYNTLLSTYGTDENGALVSNEEDYLASFSPIGKGEKCFISITDAVIEQKALDETISLRVQASGEGQYPNGYVGTENTTYGVEDWPLLKVTVGIIDSEEFEENRNRILCDKKEFLDSIEVSEIGAYGSYDYSNATVGAYPVDLYEYALQMYEKASNATGVYEKAELLVQLCDAVRVLKDNQIKSTDIDSNANLFFTQAEMEALKARINGNESLMQQYLEIKEISDAASLEELQKLKTAIFTNDTNAADALGVLNYSTIGSGSNAKTVKTKDMTLVSGASADDVAYAEVVVHLSSESDYQGNGINNGYFAYVDNFVLKDATGNVTPIKNADFKENADNWSYIGIDTTYATATEQALAGSTGKWSTTVSFRQETGALYFENQAANGNGAWVSDRFAITPGSYSLTFSLKQHVVFLGEGVEVVLRYYDNAGNYIGYSTNYCNNFKSGASFGSWSSRFQADAFVYAISGDEQYAEKCILDLIMGANDFAQGSEHWMYNASRPYGIDAYGAVQGGRFVNALATTYSLVKNYEGWSEEDRELLAELCLYITGDLNDIRDRSEMTPKEVAAGTTNWNMDMAIGSAMLGLAFDGLPGWEYGLQYYNNGYITLLGQCTEINIYGQDGAWNESVRYHNAAISKICVFAKSMRHMLGENWFSADSDVQLGKSLFYNVLLQTPSYQYSEEQQYIGTPVYGDHVLTNGNEFSYIGLYFDEVAKVNPIQAYSMWKTWQKAGSPLTVLNGDSNMLESFFAPLAYDTKWLTEKGYSVSDAENAYNSIGSTDTGSMGVDSNLDGHVTAQENQQVMDYWSELEKTITAEKGNTYKSHGIMVFRNHFNQIGKESYLCMMANEQEVAHNHNDQLAIQLFVNNTPLILDVGIGSYWDLSKGTYTLSSAHGLTQFINADGTECATLNASSVTPAAAQLDFYASDNYDFMSAQTWKSASHTDGTITRNIGYVKSGLEAYIIWDKVEGASEGVKAQFNLPLYAQTTPTIDCENNKVAMNGFNGTNLDIFFLNTDITEENANVDTILLPTTYMVEKRTATDVAATVDLLHVRTERENDDFLTVLFPSIANADTDLQIKQLSSNTSGIQVYEMKYSDAEKECLTYLILNPTEMDATIAIDASDNELINLKDAEKCSVDAGAVEIKANSMMVLQNKEETEENTSINNVPNDELVQNEVVENGSAESIITDEDIGSEDSDFENDDNEETTSILTNNENKQYLQEGLNKGATQNSTENTPKGMEEIKDSEKETLLSKGKTNSKNLLYWDEIMVSGEKSILPLNSFLKGNWLEQESAEYKNVVTILDKEKKKYGHLAVIEINLFDQDGKALHQLNGYVEVSMPLPEEFVQSDSIYVYRLEEDATLTKCETYVKGEQIRFMTDHFSTFVLVGEESNDEGVNGQNALIAVVLLLISIALGIICFTKKRIDKVSKE